MEEFRKLVDKARDDLEQSCVNMHLKTNGRPDLVALARALVSIQKAFRLGGKEVKVKLGTLPWVTR